LSGPDATAKAPNPHAAFGGAGFRRMFAPDRLTLGVMAPIENYGFAMPALEGQERMARAAEERGFAAVWVRDVPLLDPGFGDVGQVYDPWVTLTWLAAHTETVALATGSIILPLRHPLHVAKAASSLDHLTGGRLVLGVASGDRPIEFPAFGRPHHRRDALFREALSHIRRSWSGDFPDIETTFGRLQGADLVPKPKAGPLPMLVTGFAGQTIDWIAENGDGWLTYMRPPSQQRQVIEAWRRAVASVAPDTFKPFAQGLHLDLAEDSAELASPIHNGYRVGRHQLAALLDTLQAMGVHHAILGLRFGRRPALAVLDELARHIVPHFPANSVG